jgi:Uma2 family endonuclease
MIFHDGVLEIMSPEYPHEVGAERLGLLIRAVALVFDIDCQGSGSTTFRRGQRGLPRGFGREPDRSYYFARAAAIRRNKVIDLDVDPPPDLWIEVDHRGSSKGRLPLYAALGVPEVWRYRPRRASLWFGQLQGGRYEEITRSVSLPMLTPPIVLELLARAERDASETAWDREVRDWLEHSLKPRFNAGG